jgi:hypothetical protein
MKDPIEKLKSLQLNSIRSRIYKVQQSPIIHSWFATYLKNHPDHVVSDDGPYSHRIGKEHVLHYLMYVDRRWLRHKARKSRALSAIKKRRAKLASIAAKLELDHKRRRRALFYDGRARAMVYKCDKKVFDLWIEQEGYDVRDCHMFPVEFCAFAEAFWLEQETKKLDDYCEAEKQAYRQEIDSKISKISEEYDAWVAVAEKKGTKGAEALRANLKRSLLKKRASLEYAAFQEYYKKTYGEVLGRSVRKSAKRMTSKRRELLRVSQDSRTRQKIRAINSSPCRCHWCDVFLPDGGEADHVTPLSKGGKHVPNNIVPSCRKCNERKGGDFASVENVIAPELPLL